MERGPSYLAETTPGEREREREREIDRSRERERDRQRERGIYEGI